MLEVNLAGTPGEEVAEVLHALEGRISPQPGPPGEVSKTPERVQIPTCADFQRAGLQPRSAAT